MRKARSDTYTGLAWPCRVSQANRRWDPVPSHEVSGGKRSLHLWCTLPACQATMPVPGIPTWNHGCKSNVAATLAISTTTLRASTYIRALRLLIGCTQSSPSFKCPPRLLEARGDVQRFRFPRRLLRTTRRCRGCNCSDGSSHTS